jgi:transketolase
MRKTCIDMVHELAKRDERVVFIGSDLSPGLLKEMKDEFPDRYYMEGVAEQNIIGMAAGMALEGYMPFVNTIATFITRRCFEQVAVDACLHHLPIRLIANGGGLVYAPLGPTHLAIEDLAIMRSLPNMTVTAVCDADEMKRLMLATLDWPHPIYIRLAKGGDPVISKEENGFTIGKAILLKDYPSPRRGEAGRGAGLENKILSASQDCPPPTPPPTGGGILFISTGVASQRTLAAADILEKEGTHCRVLHMHTVKPLDTEAVLKYASDASLVVTAEEGTLMGGLGSAVAECLMEHGLAVPFKRLGIPDRFPEHYGSQDDLMRTYGLQPDQIADTVRSYLGASDDRRTANR